MDERTQRTYLELLGTDDKRYAPGLREHLAGIDERRRLARKADEEARRRRERQERNETPHQGSRERERRLRRAAREGR